MPQKIPGVWGLAPNEAGKISDLPIDSFKDRRCYFADGTRSVPATFADGRTMMAPDRPANLIARFDSPQQLAGQ